MRLGISWTGVMILVALFVILGAENVYIWIIAEAVPGVEFLLALTFVLAVAFAAIRETRVHPSSQQSLARWATLAYYSRRSRQYSGTSQHAER